MRLPGIGRRRAEAIVELRKRLKRFRTANDLLRVRGIGPKSLKRMLPQLVVDAPAQ
jgi:competence protein ComEA